MWFSAGGSSPSVRTRIARLVPSMRRLEHLSGGLCGITVGKNTFSAGSEVRTDARSLAGHLQVATPVDLW